MLKENLSPHGPLERCTYCTVVPDGKLSIIDRSLPVNGKVPSMTGIIKLNQANFKSLYYGYSNWILITKMIGYPADMCYQLTASYNQSIDVEKQVMDEDGEWHDCDTENEALDVIICNDITFRIIIQNNGGFPLYDIGAYDVLVDKLKYISADPEPDDFVYDPPYYYINWYFPGELMPDETIEIEITAHVEGPECSTEFNFVEVIGNYSGLNFTDDDYCYVHAYEKSRVIKSPFLSFLENHQFLLKIFQIMFHRLGL